MKSKFKSWSVGIVTCLSVVAPTQAGLDVGDKAPALSIVEWVKGDAVDVAKNKNKNKIHVVEFWAVWCPPCKMSIPLLTDLQKKYEKDVVILGVTEPDGGQNSPASIRRFVKSKGKEMAYTIAIDGGKTSRDYMVAAGAMGIPHAFIVDKSGMIAWQGSPLDPALDSVLGKIVAGKYDVKTAQEEARLEREVGGRMDRLNMFVQTGQWRNVWDGLVEILKIDPSNEVAIDILMRVSAEELGNMDEYRKWVRSHMDAHRDDAVVMQRLSYTLCTIESPAARCPDLAIEAARLAYEAGHKRDAAGIVIYARALYQIGALDRAITIHQDAIAVADESDREALRDILEFYRTCKRLRTALP